MYDLNRIIDVINDFTNTSRTNEHIWTNKEHKRIWEKRKNQISGLDFLVLFAKQEMFDISCIIYKWFLFTNQVYL